MSSWTLGITLTLALAVAGTAHGQASRSAEPAAELAATLHSQPSSLNERIRLADHEGTYFELNGAGLRDGKLFVQDLGAPGLHGRRTDDGTFDIVYESGATRTLFNGDWTGQGLSRDDYLAAFERADHRYALALGALLEALTEATARETAEE
jgi:hypothetical protein